MQALPVAVVTVASTAQQGCFQHLAGRPGRCEVLFICFVQGMAMVELLRQLERRAGAPIWTLFDVIGGTSTGGLLAVSLGLLQLNLDACQEIYTSLGNKVRTLTVEAAMYVAAG
jgi:hypothetical protein